MLFIKTSQTWSSWRITQTNVSKKSKFRRNKFSAKTFFGKTLFGKHMFRPKLFSAKTYLGQKNLGKTNFGQSKSPAKQIFGKNLTLSMARRCGYPFIRCFLTIKHFKSIHKIELFLNKKTELFYFRGAKWPGGTAHRGPGLCIRLHFLINNIMTSLAYVRIYWLLHKK